MKIEQHLRFPKSRRKKISGLSAVHRPARISHQSPKLVVDRNNHSSAHYPGTSIEADSEPGRRAFMDLSSSYTSVGAIHIPKRKLQRWVDKAISFRNPLL